jgi:cadmium resistance transport/sequestration family protein
MRVRVASGGLIALVAQRIERPAPTGRRAGSTPVKGTARAAATARRSTAVLWPTVRGVVGTVLAAAGVFAGTNIDDLIVLMLLSLSSRAAGKPKPWQIWAGQYLGIGALVAVSAVAALGLTIVPDDWVGLLGLVPLGLGVWGVVRARCARGVDGRVTPAVATGLVSIAGIAIANGADNIAVYTPTFRTIGMTASLITVAVFAVGVAVWCLAGSLLGSHKTVIRLVERWGHWIVPLVFITIGVVIMVSSGVVGRII